MLLLWINDVVSKINQYFQQDKGLVYLGMMWVGLLFVLCIGCVFFWIQTKIVGFIMSKFYKIVYGKLITQLTTNYTELVKSEQD